MLSLVLIGKDVSKSGSEKIHTFILNRLGYACKYTRVSVGKEDFLKQAKILLEETDGFNVTIPYKVDVMQLLNGVVGDAETFGAVNTVVTESKTGYNTDGVGLMQMLKSAGFFVKGKRVLILGVGGAGRSTAVALKNAGATVYLYQRRKDLLKAVCKELGVLACEDVEKFDGEIIVNATGVGMHDTEGVSPVEKNVFQGKEGAVDLIYEPKESEFLRLAKEQGIKTLNGEAMLFYQAYYADCLYLKRQADEKEAENLYALYIENETTNGVK